MLNLYFIHFKLCGKWYLKLYLKSTLFKFCTVMIIFYFVTYGVFQLDKITSSDISVVCQLDMNTIPSEIKTPNPVKNANWFSELFFLYVFPIFYKSYKKEMTDEDIFETLPDQRSGLLGDRLEEIWKEEYGTLKYRETALHRSLLRLFGGRFLLYGIIKGLGDFLMVILLPISIQKVVSHFQGKNDMMSKREVYVYSGLISLVFVMDAITTHPVFMGLSNICMKIRIACSSLIYRKALRLNNLSLTKTTVGQVINLLSNDVSRFEEGFILCHFIWIAPIQVCFGVYLIYREIQVSALFGIAFLLAFIPLQIWVGKKTSDLRLQTAIKTDERVKIMSEIITGIQVIKMYCWEKPFSKLIEHVRKGEMEAIRRRNFLIGIIFALEMFITRTSIFISIISFVFMGNYITADKVFVITGIYNVIRPLITSLFSISVSCMAAVDVSIRRMNTFLSIDELAQCEESVRTCQFGNKNSLKNGEPKKISKKTGGGVHVRDDTKKPEIILENVDASWTENIEEKVLKSLNLKIEQNQLVTIIGPVGSGKSSLLHLLLKEMNIVGGKVDIYGKISYASQEPWLFSGSIRQNILFGEKYDEVRYKSIIKVCALEEDIGFLPHGDKTLVGERGIILSGGQKARINLARCVYREADLYLLDDPLSAVDARVGKMLYFDCVRNFLKNKICILVTHQIQYLHTSDHILMMENGLILQSGSFDQLRTEKSYFAKFLENHNSKGTDTVNNEISIMPQEACLEENVQLETKEKINHGRITFKTYYKYARAGGSILQILLLIGTFILGNFIIYGGDFYVSYWVNKEQDLATNSYTNHTKVPFSRDVIICTYTVITFGTILFSLGQIVFFVAFFTRASRNLHSSALDRVTKATMKFFHVHPSGRILNRFSEDIGVVDEILPFILYDVVRVTLLFLSVVVLTSYVEIFMLPISLIMGIFFVAFRAIFLRTSRNVKRIIAITRSPLYSHITASLNGLTTIRAFNACSLLINEFDNLQDRNTSAKYLFLATTQCFGFWINFICAYFISVATFVIVVLNEDMHGGDIGLVITEYIALLTTVDWGMRQWSECENKMVSTERMIEFTSDIDIEPQRNSMSFTPKHWPPFGQLEFKNVSLKYNDTDPCVLKNISFSAAAGEKIGIVGRTGAGKSSIITSLFQLYPFEGSIIIDGVDSTKMPLSVARKHISIIPQEPILFSGTMRKNLDPFGDYDKDEIIWDALEQVELKATVQKLPSGLDTLVTSSGSNFSVGEKQLICLARALIRRNKILVLDEATANVDPYTDSLIQKTIRNKFSKCTILTIAHRLNTVMDSDKILVMKNGEVAEFDHPYSLLNNGGLLHDLILFTGETMFKNLELVAKQNFNEKNVSEKKKSPQVKEKEEIEQNTESSVSLK